MHWLLFLALWGGLAFSLVGVIPLDYHWWVMIPLGIGFIIWGINIEKRKAKDQLSIEREKDRVDRIEKESLLKKYGLPINCPTYQYLNGHGNIMGKEKINVWIKDNHINLLTNTNMAKYQIPLENIHFYSVKGDIRQETETTGGDATLGEVIVAEGLLGTAAAMKKNQVIQETKTIDERKTIINATIDGKSNFIFFEGAELYNYLLENFPEKEQSFVAMNK